MWSMEHMPCAQTVDELLDNLHRVHQCWSATDGYGSAKHNSSSVSLIAGKIALEHGTHRNLSIFVFSSTPH